MPDPDPFDEPRRSGAGGRLLVLGASVRALTASAARSPVTRRRFPGGILAIDYFGDTDLKSGAVSLRGDGRQVISVVSVSRDLGLPRSTASLVRAALAHEWSGLAYTGGLENRPGILRLLARRPSADGSIAAILGNGARAVAAVRDPRRLFPFLQSSGIPHATVRFEGAIPDGPRPADAGSWLIKKSRSAGGTGVRMGIPGAPLPPGCFFQERLHGPVGSAAFLADGKQSVLLGICEQLSGWEALGASGFRYAGNIAGPWSAFMSPEAHDQIGRTARRITERFGLCGLNGLDYILHRGVPHLIEVNPRWTASMELIEERTDRALFDLHLLASDGAAGGPAGPSLPKESDAQASGRFLAKGILYATASCIAPEPAALESLGARDRPAMGERLAPGQPICTLIVEGEGAAACRARLEEKALAVRSRLTPA